MGDSNSAWGELVTVNDEFASLFDTYDRLPDAGDHPALDAFVARKNLQISDLVRLGARLSDYNVLAFAGAGWIKYRDVVTDKRWGLTGSTFKQLKLIPGHGKDGKLDTVLVVEGETDAARVSGAYPHIDIAMLPAGARAFPPAYAEQLAGYELVLVGLDNDQAGDDGAAKILAALPKAVRFTAPANDWCEATELPRIPRPDEIERPAAERLLITVGEMRTLDVPEQLSYFEDALLPIGGQLILHGWIKSFKSYLALDLAAALATGSAWCNFESTDEPIKVGIMQYEIPFGYFRQRVEQLRAGTTERDLFDENLHVWTPLARPRFRAGDKVAEDQLLGELQAAGCQAFLLDPIRRATGTADLNSEAEVRPLLAFYARLQDEGIAVVTCHHDNKTQRNSGDPAGMTGSGAFGGDADTIVSVAVPKGMTVEDPMRDLHFLMRNAPSPSPRGMSMTESGLIVYGSSHAAPDAHEPTPLSDEAPI